MTVTNRSDFADFLCARGYTVGVEVGVWKGEHAALLLERVPLRRLYCVDTWDGTGMGKDFDGNAVKAEAVERLDKYGRRANIIQADSVEASTDLRFKNLDFVYIDGDHSYEGCKADILAWRGAIRSGGVLCGHDYCNRGWKNVKDAVDECFGRGVYSSTERCSEWWVIV